MSKTYKSGDLLISKVPTFPGVLLMLGPEHYLVLKDGRTYLNPGIEGEIEHGGAPSEETWRVVGNICAPDFDWGKYLKEVSK